MEEEEVFEAVLAAHERWARTVQYEIMQALDRLGFPCETWKEAEELTLWLLGDVHGD